MTNRKFYRRVIQYEILTEEPFTPQDLEQIYYETQEGQASGRFLPDIANEVIDGATAARLLQEHASDPEFFLLTEDGEDVEE